jgi:hypothetical protein
MLRKLFGVALGIVLALQFDRWLEQRRQKFTPSALTGSFLDQLNKRLERTQSETK